VKGGKLLIKLDSGWLQTKIGVSRIFISEKGEVYGYRYYYRCHLSRSGNTDDDEKDSRIIGAAYHGNTD